MCICVSSPIQKSVSKFDPMSYHVSSVSILESQQAHFEQVLGVNSEVVVHVLVSGIAVLVLRVMSSFLFSNIASTM